MLILDEIIGVAMFRLEYAYLLEKSIGPPTEAMLTWWKFQLDNKILKSQMR